MAIIRSNRNPELLRRDDALLIVVDMQEPFLRNIWERDRVINNSLILIKTAEVLRMPIVPTLQYEKRMGGLIREIARAIPHQFVPFDKICFSAIGEDTILSEIARSGRKHILLCGVETHICIFQTAMDLQHLGYRVSVVGDAVSSRTEANWKFGLERLRQAGIAVPSTEMAAYELMEEAGTPEFKQIVELIK